MVIQSDKISDQVSDFEEMNPQETSFDGTYLKTCVDCGTTKTPLWRGGPSGPKSLCNACGIRSRKKRRALMGIINKEDKKPKKSTMIKHNNQQINNISISSSSSSSSSSSEESSSKYDEISLKKKKKKKLLAFGGKVAYQRPRSNSINKKRKLGEVEQAAFLLMFLSCAPVYA